MTDTQPGKIDRLRMATHKAMVLERQQLAMALGRRVLMIVKDLPEAGRPAIPADRPSVITGSFAEAPGYVAGKTVMLGIIQACLTDKQEFAGMLNGMASALAETFGSQEPDHSVAT